MQRFANELVHLKSDLIVAHSTAVVAALQRETSTIPIVFVFVSDPVGSGFIASLPHPGGNITGFINIESSFGGQMGGVVKGDRATRATRVALIHNPDTARYAQYYLGPFVSASRSSGIEPMSAPVRKRDGGWYAATGLRRKHSNAVDPHSVFHFPGRCRSSRRRCPLETSHRTHFARLAIGGGFEDQIGPHAVDDSDIGTNAKSHDVRYTTAIGGKADVPRTSRFCSE